MEVTLDNFTTAFSIFEKELNNADFVAIDAEFSGLSTLKYKKPGYDTLESWYTKICCGTSKMLLIQYGISLFTWKEMLNKYEATPFTFYIFPQLYKSYGNDIAYTSQSSSMRFLAKNGFDFNKLFHKGVSFMSLFEEEKARDNIEKEMALFMKQNNQNCESKRGESKVIIPEDQEEFIARICDTIESFMKDESIQATDLPVCDSMQRKLIYNVLEEKYAVRLFLECISKETGEPFIRANKTAVSLKNNIQRLKRQDEESSLNEVVGFSNVIKLLVQSKKPVVGHNMFLDLFLTYTNFFGLPPHYYRDFKGFLTNLFPVLFDTKVIARFSAANESLLSTGLEDLMESIDKKQIPHPDVVISEKLKDQDEYKSEYHQAGYDAYCTGRVFISLYEYLSNSVSQRIDFKHGHFKQFINQVYIMGIRDIKFSNFSRDEPLLKRKCVFYVHFPVSWKSSSIESIFSPHCSLTYPINWINNESAFVTISDEDCYDDVLHNLVNVPSSEHDEFYVLPYSDYVDNKTSHRNGNEIVPCKRKRVGVVHEESVKNISV